MSVDMAELRGALHLLEEFDVGEGKDESAETAVMRALVGLGEAIDKLGEGRKTEIAATTDRGAFALGRR